MGSPGGGAKFGVTPGGVNIIWDDPGRGCDIWGDPGGVPIFGGPRGGPDIWDEPGGGLPHRPQRWAPPGGWARAPLPPLWLEPRGRGGAGGALMASRPRQPVKNRREPEPKSPEFAPKPPQGLPRRGDPPPPRPSPRPQVSGGGCVGGAGRRLGFGAVLPDFGTSTVPVLLPLSFLQLCPGGGAFVPPLTGPSVCVLGLAGGISQHIVACRDVSPCVATYHGMSRCIAVCQDVSLHVMTYRSVSWHIAACPDISRHVTTYRGVSRYIITCLDLAVCSDIVACHDTYRRVTVCSGCSRVSPCPSLGGGTPFWATFPLPRAQPAPGTVGALFRAPPPPWDPVTSPPVMSPP